MCKRIDCEDEEDFPMFLKVMIIVILTAFCLSTGFSAYLYHQEQKAERIEMMR